MRHYFLIVALGEIFYGLVLGQNSLYHNQNPSGGNLQLNIPRAAEHEIYNPDEFKDGTDFLTAQNKEYDLKNTEVKDRKYLLEDSVSKDLMGFQPLIKNTGIERQEKYSDLVSPNTKSYPDTDPMPSSGSNGKVRVKRAMFILGSPGPRRRNSSRTSNRRSGKRKRRQKISSINPSAFNNPNPFNTGPRIKIPNDHPGMSYPPHFFGDMVAGLDSSLPPLQVTTESSPETNQDINSPDKISQSKITNGNLNKEISKAIIKDFIKGLNSTLPPLKPEDTEVDTISPDAKVVIRDFLSELKITSPPLVTENIEGTTASPTSSKFGSFKAFNFPFSSSSNRRRSFRPGNKRLGSRRPRNRRPGSGRPGRDRRRKIRTTTTTQTPVITSEEQNAVTTKVYEKTSTNVSPANLASSPETLPPTDGIDQSQSQSQSDMQKLENVSPKDTTSSTSTQTPTITSETTNAVTTNTYDEISTSKTTPVFPSSSENMKSTLYFGLPSSSRRPRKRRRRKSTTTATTQTPIVTSEASTPFETTVTEISATSVTYPTSSFINYMSKFMGNESESWNSSKPIKSNTAKATTNETSTGETNAQSNKDNSSELDETLPDGERKAFTNADYEVFYTEKYSNDKPPKNNESELVMTVIRNNSKDPPEKVHLVIPEEAIRRNSQRNRNNRFKPYSRTRNNFPRNPNERRMFPRKPGMRPNRNRNGLRRRQRPRMNANRRFRPNSYISAQNASTGSHNSNETPNSYNIYISDGKENNPVENEKSPTDDKVEPDSDYNQGALDRNDKDTEIVVEPSDQSSSNPYQSLEEIISKLMEHLGHTPPDGAKKSEETNEKREDDEVGQRQAETEVELDSSKNSDSLLSEREVYYPSVTVPTFTTMTSSNPVQKTIIGGPSDYQDFSKTSYDSDMGQNTNPLTGKFDTAGSDRDRGNAESIRRRGGPNVRRKKPRKRRKKKKGRPLNQPGNSSETGPPNKPKDFSDFSSEDKFFADLFKKLFDKLDQTSTTEAQSTEASLLIETSPVSKSTSPETLSTLEMKSSDLQQTSSIIEKTPSRIYSFTSTEIPESTTEIKYASSSTIMSSSSTEMSTEEPLSSSTNIPMTSEVVKTTIPSTPIEISLETTEKLVSSTNTPSTSTELPKSSTLITSTISSTTTEMPPNKLSSIKVTEMPLITDIVYNPPEISSSSTIPSTNLPSSSESSSTTNILKTSTEIPETTKITTFSVTSSTEISSETSTTATSISEIPSTSTQTYISTSTTMIPEKMVSVSTESSLPSTQISTEINFISTEAPLSSTFSSSSETSTSDIPTSSSHFLISSTEASSTAASPAESTSGTSTSFSEISETSTKTSSTIAKTAESTSEMSSSSLEFPISSTEASSTTTNPAESTTKTSSSFSELSETLAETSSTIAKNTKSTSEMSASSSESPEISTETPVMTSTTKLLITSTEKEFSSTQPSTEPSSEATPVVSTQTSLDRNSASVSTINILDSTKPSTFTTESTSVLTSTSKIPSSTETSSIATESPVTTLETSSGSTESTKSPLRTIETTTSTVSSSTQQISSSSFTSTVIPESTTVTISTEQETTKSPEKSTTQLRTTNYFEEEKSSTYSTKSSVTTENLSTYGESYSLKSTNEPSFTTKGDIASERNESSTVGSTSTDDIPDYPVTAIPPPGVECMENETYYRCVPHCQHMCFNYDSDVPCMLKFCEPGCFCSPGLVIDENGKCVAVEDCDIQACGIDEEWWDCVPECHNTCENYARSDACKDEVCVPGCFCKDGYIKDVDGSCVEPEECRNPICLEHELKTDCISPCNNCYDNCHSCKFKSCREGCDCVDGYKRDSKGKCIKAAHCPQCVIEEDVYANATAEVA